MKGVYVVLDARKGEISRWTRDMKGKKIKTHEAIAPEGGPVTFTQDIVDQFHNAPPEEFRLHRDTTPPTPPAGGTPVAMARAA